jgi:hypothetical protein
MRAAVVGLVALVAGGASAADPVALRWKLAKGDTFYVRTVNEMQQTIGVLGQNMEQNQTSTSVARFKVLDATADGGLTVEQTITKVDIVGNLPGAADQAGKMKGATLTFTLDKDYKVTKVDGYDKYIEQISGGNDQAAQVVKAATSEETLKVSVEDMLNPGPGKPVAPGDKWTRETKLPLGPLGTFAVNARYTLDGVDAGAAKVSYDADATFTAGKGGDGLPFQITKGEMKADKYTGTMTFDTAAGRLKESSQNVKLGGALTVSAMGQEIELTFQQTLKVTSSVTATDPGD